MGFRDVGSERAYPAGIDDKRGNFDVEYAAIVRCLPREVTILKK